MIKIGDLVAVESPYGHFVGIVMEYYPEYTTWQYTVIKCDDGEPVPCDPDEMQILDTARQADDWERKKNIQKILDKSKNHVMLDNTIQQVLNKKGSDYENT